MTDNLLHKRILVVEDEPIVSMLLEDMIIDAGATIVGPAFRLDEALSMAQAEDIDAAILDVNLGGQRSDDVAKTLEQRGIPYMYVTGYGEFADTRVPVVPKPFDVNNVRSTLTKLVNGAA